MSMYMVKIVDIQHPNTPVDIEDLTKDGAYDMIYQANLLIDDLKDVAEAADEN